MTLVQRAREALTRRLLALLPDCCDHPDLADFPEDTPNG